MKRTLQSILMAAMIVTITCAAAAHSQAAVAVKPEWQKKPATFWTAVKANWDKNVKTYSTSIFSWGYSTQTFIKYENKQFPLKAGEKPRKENWSYRIYDTKFRKPNWVWFQYSKSLNENMTDGTIINKAVGMVLRYTGGTTFTYGYKDTTSAYIKFPYISNEKFATFPVSLADKAVMKLLMIASRKEIYKRPLSELRDSRGYSIDGLIISNTMAKFDRYFNKADKDIKVTISTAPRLGEKDYTLNEKTGWATIKPASLKKTPELIKLTLTDKNASRCRGVTKIELFVDPANMMFAGLHEYEGNKFVSTMMFSDMQLNIDVPESEFENFFKGRTIGDK